MTRPRKFFAAAIAALSLGVVLAPAAAAQVPGGGSVVIPEIAPIPVPTPAGIDPSFLPPLPKPWFWQSPYIASNWVEMGTGCPAANEWAYTQDGTKVWCARKNRMDGHAWAPQPGTFDDIPGGLHWGKTTRVENSLGGRPCESVNKTAINPSNGQTAYCDWHLIDSAVPVWQFR
ncbi:hypothetical protein [Dietzia sp.]|uniref:hypothetical protein n=1 Tax=Dietzia sp. TaxID=1871616 RepID=UPI002FD96D6B